MRRALAGIALAALALYPAPAYAHQAQAWTSSHHRASHTVWRRCTCAMS